MGESDKEYARRYQKMCDSDDEKPPEQAVNPEDIGKEFCADPE